MQRTKEKDDPVIDEIASSMNSGKRLIYIAHKDFEEVDNIINKIFDKLYGEPKKNEDKIEEFNSGLGCIKFRSKTKKGNASDLHTYLKIVNNYTTDKIIVLKDIHAEIKDPKICNMLRHLVTKKTDSIKCGTQYIIIVSSTINIPSEIEMYTDLFEIVLPDANKLESLISQKIQEINNDRDTEIEVNEDFIRKYALSMKGLTLFEASSMVDLAYHNFASEFVENGFEGELNKMILTYKNKKLKKTGLLELISPQEDKDSIGGLDLLKEYLEKKAKIFCNLPKAMECKVDIPKGILLVGIPGCGKSLAAKVSANIFKVPLLRFDMSKILGKYLGESETNLRNSIQIAEAISPCVLWIDEVEKVFAGAGSSQNGHEVTIRLVGSFLTWMQDKKSEVYIIATSNDISGLPPEFIRKGRFDDKFFIGLPSLKERQSIFSIHLEKRGLHYSEDNIIDFSRHAEKFTSADIEDIVIKAKEQLFLNDIKEPNRDVIKHLIEEIKKHRAGVLKKYGELLKTFGSFDLRPSSKYS